MKNILKSRNLISGLVAIPLLALCFSQKSVQAQESGPQNFPTETIKMTYGVVGLCYEQSLRFNLTYAPDPAASSQQPSIRALAQVKDTTGNTIYVSSSNGGVWKTVNGGQSWSFEVNRAQFPLPGALRTGALSLVLELVIEFPQGVIVDLPSSLEITDDVTGKVVLYDGNIVTRQQPATAGNVYTVTFQGALFSAMPGETFRVNFTNPLPLALANHTVAAVDYLLKIDGIDGEVVHTRQGTVRSGQTIVVEVNRDQLPGAGDPSTGRLGLAAEITYSIQLTADQLVALGQSPQFPVSFELVDNLTGRTTARKGKTFLIFVPTPYKPVGK